MIDSLSLVERSTAKRLEGKNSFDHWYIEETKLYYA